jgi:2-keto-4-pentenoate hydratase/2-oxohepta-3-ene-1,7-dioic acid hydratase in catechol pathway
MKFVRLATAAGPAWAREEDGRYQHLGAAPWDAGTPTGAATELAAAKLLAPAQPTKIVAIGLNYKDHAAERGKPLPEEPLMFLKPPSSLIGPGEAIRIRPWVGRVDHEAELGVVIGRKAANLKDPQDAAPHIFGFTCVNDVTARTLQDKDVQFTRAKSFDTFCPIGPWVVSGIDHRDLVIEGRVNGQVRQKSTTAQLIFSVEHLVWAVSRVMTLLPGDVISTGTPAGIGPLAKGDVVEVEVGGIGILSNPVAGDES